MAKIANEYLIVEPWRIVEKGYKFEKNQVSESIFSLGNEYMGIRGFFEEGISLKNTMVGSYFNGIYEYAKEDVGSHYKGIIKKTHFMINSVNWLYTIIKVDDEKLDLATSKIIDFERILDLKTGELKRTFIWELKDNRRIRITFYRLLSMTNVEYGVQKIVFLPINFSGKASITIGLDFSIKHWGKQNTWTIVKKDIENHKLMGKTKTNQLVASGYKTSINQKNSSESFYQDKKLLEKFSIDLNENQENVIEKYVVNVIDKKQASNKKNVWEALNNKMNKSLTYDEVLKSNREYYTEFWNHTDIEIIGDEKNQQGIRYCLFQLEQTYHGVDDTNNIGAKGLTGEAYSGHAFWDTETYCFPFYLFNNIKAAQNLLMYRYNTLEEAKLRAKDLDCKGACYPIATLNGHEGSSLWQHASLQPQPSTAVFYAIWHYVQVTKDISFLINYGLEMLIEISRYLASRGDFNSDKTKFGFFGVMGPDEFQLMVNHDMYTNYMGRKAIEYTLKALEVVKKTDNNKFEEVIKKVEFKGDELELFKKIVSKMHIIYDDKTKIFEQHQGYFDLPHIDIHSIPVTDFPLYSNWSYDRIYRNDMIKQPAVLMAMLLFNQDFSMEQKKKNYDFYEPRTIHESSLSPSVHSILAAEIGKIDEAVDFFGFATRMDLDDYNRNTSEGLHTTSIAAAWMNIVYGFGGVRSDGQTLIINPIIPKTWEKYIFRILYQKVLIKVEVTNSEILITTEKDIDQDIIIRGKKYRLKKGVTKIEQ